MKLLYSILIFSSFACAMQDPANMSREMLEQAFRAQQVTIAQQNETIAKQTATLKLFHNLYHGTQLEKSSAQADLKALQQRHYLNQNSLGK